MSNKVKITKEQFNALNTANAAGVMRGMYDLIDDLVSACNDEVAENLWEELKARINSAESNALKIVGFDIAGDDDD